MASKTPDNVSEQLRNELKSLADTLEELLQTSSDKSETEIQKLKAKAENIIKTSRQTLTDSSDKLVEQTKEVAGKADNYVHEKPWNGIGIAAAVGLVVGVLLAKR